MKRLISLVAALGLIVLVARPGVAVSAETHVAVAANFTEAAKEVAAAFKKETGDDAVLSFGSSGQLYTQITQAAPYDILLSADDERPKKAVAEGFGAEDSRFTYAIGKLVLWSKDVGLVGGEGTLAADKFAKLSIANPAAAPYGVAAVETLKALKLYDRHKDKIVQGNSIAQAYQFVDTGNAELGFVAQSQLTGVNTGSRWIVPQTLYTPIRQDAVLLKSGAANPVATAFLKFLKSAGAREIIGRYGYAFSVDG